MSRNIVAALSAGKFKKLFVFVAAALMLSGCGQSSNEQASKDAAVKNEATPVAVQQTIRVSSFPFTTKDYRPFITKEERTLSLTTLVITQRVDSSTVRVLS